MSDPKTGEREAACPWCHYGDPHPTFSDCPATPDAGDATTASNGLTEAERETLLDCRSPGALDHALIPDVTFAAVERIVAAREAAAATRARAEGAEQALREVRALAADLAARAEGKHDLASETDYNVDVARFNGEGTGLGVAHMLVAELADSIARSAS